MAIHVELLHKKYRWQCTTTNGHTCTVVTQKMIFPTQTPRVTMESGGLENPDNISKNVKFEFFAPCSVLQVLTFYNTLHFWYNLAFKKTGNVHTYECNIEVHSCSHCCCGKPVRITYSECTFAALGIQHAICVSLPGYTIFSTLSHKDMIFGGKKKLLSIKYCVFIFSSTSVWNTSHSKKNWVRYDKNIYCILCIYIYIYIHVNYLLFSSNFN